MLACRLSNYWCWWMASFWHLMTIAESICAHYSNLSGQHDIFLGSGTFKISKSRVQKKQGHWYSKREKTRLPLLFFNNDDLGYLHPVFFKKQGAWFLRIVGADWLGDCVGWAKNQNKLNPNRFHCPLITYLTLNHSVNNKSSLNGPTTEWSPNK